MKRWLLVIAGAVSSQGCIAASTYTTARTVDEGESQHTVGLSMFAMRRDEETRLMPVPMPSYAFTYGFRNDFDGSVQVSLPGRLRLEAKYNPIRSEYFDVAIAPATYVQLFPGRNGGGDDSSILLGMELPVIANFNFMSSVSLVGYFGPAYAAAPQLGAGAPYFRTGGGLNMRGDGYAIQPEVSIAYDPTLGTARDVAFGVGLSL
jgi:hypothetical protein